MKEEGGGGREAVKIIQVGIVKLGRGVVRDSSDGRFFGERVPSKWDTVQKYKPTQ